MSTTPEDWHLSKRAIQRDLFIPVEHQRALRESDELVDVRTLMHRYAWALEHDGPDAAVTKKYAERLLYEAYRFVMKTSAEGRELPPWPKQYGSAGAFLAKQMREAGARARRRRPLPVDVRQVVLRGSPAGRPSLSVAFENWNAQD